MAALTPECYAGACAMCDSDACGCDCHLDPFDGDSEGVDICEFCGDWYPCDCDIQLMEEMEDDEAAGNE